MALIDQADVVVIGSGGLGAATAFHLAKRGASRVALVDKHDLASQTSPRAAGMVSHVRSTDLMVRLIGRAGELIKRFSEDTGQPLDWTQSGSLKIARRPQDAEILEGELPHARERGLDVELISAGETHRLHPFVQIDGVVAAMRIGDDMYFDPSQVAIGFVKAAETLGVTLVPHTCVTGVQIENGRVAAVETDRGRIRTAVVVDAAGAWTRQVAAVSGIHIPLVPTRHQLFVTEPVNEAAADLPMVRIMDAGVYVRPCDGGFLWGGFEANPLSFEMESLGADFGVEATPLDAEVLWRMAREVKGQLPILLDAKVREHRGGIPTMTSDGQHILGPAPGANGFFIASGCNVAGLSASPAIGELLAEWILLGRPSLDLSPLSIERFGTEPHPEAQLQRETAWQYHHFYGSA